MAAKDYDGWAPVVGELLGTAAAGTITGVVIFYVIPIVASRLLPTVSGNALAGVRGPGVLVCTFVGMVCGIVKYRQQRKRSARWRAEGDFRRAQRNRQARDEDREQQ